MDDEVPPLQWSRERLIQYIKDQAKAKGLNPDFAARVAELESQFRPGIKSKTSSARGLFQLTDDRRKELKLDPIKNREMSVEDEVEYGLRSLKQNRDYLAPRLGREPEHYEMYAAHFSGPYGSYKVLTASPDTRIERVLSPKALKANKQLRGKTVGQIRDEWQARFGDMPQELSSTPAPVRPTPQQLERQVGPPIDESQPDWDLIGRGQLTAQAPSDEPVMLADGGDVGEKLAQMIENAKTDAHFREINSLIAAHYPRHRASGSPPEGEVADEPTPEELEAASKPSFRTAAAGGGRKRGNITEALQSGTAAREMLKGATMLPQNLVGAPVDIATMVMRPFGYNVEKPVMGSEWLKEKSRQAGLAYAPSGNEAERGFFAAGDILGGLVNPAAPVRGAVAAAGKTGEAAKMLAKDFQRYNQALGPADASYVTRPTGSVMATETVGGKLSGVEKIVSGGKDNVQKAIEKAFPAQVRDPQTRELTWLHEEGTRPPLTTESREQLEGLLDNFWETKARNYFTKQYGTPRDPIAEGIARGQIYSSAFKEDQKFPSYMLKNLYVGKTKVSPQTGESRFYPEDPTAWEDFHRNYDRATGIVGDIYLTQPNMLDPRYSTILTPEANQAALSAKEAETTRLMEQGVDPAHINQRLQEVVRSAQDPNAIVAGFSHTPRAKELLTAYEQKLQGATEPVHGLSQSTITAIEKGQPIYDIDYIGKPLQALFDSNNINYYLASIPPREAAAMRFEDVVKNAAKKAESRLNLEGIRDAIRAGKPVPNKVYEEGVSAPLMTFPEGSPFNGYAWKKIEDRKATVPEGAYIGHSVGGYELGGAGYPPEKRKGFLTGEYQIFTLRDPRNRPVTTIELKRNPEGEMEIKQIKGDGRATGNVPPVKHEEALVSFIENYLKPRRIMEEDKYLSPTMQQFKGRYNTRKHLEELDQLGALTPIQPPQAP